MALRPPTKKLSLLFIIGALLLFYGVGVSYIEQKFLWWPTAMYGLGICFILFSLFLLIKEKQMRVKGGQFKKSAFVVFIVVLFSALVIMLNYVANIYNHRFDMTKYKQHTLIDNTKTLLKELKSDVKFTAFIVGLPPKYIEDLFKEYERNSDGKITTEIIDPLVQIGYAAQFGENINSKEQKVIVQAGNERRDVDFTEYPLTQEEINNAILRVTREARRAYFLSGHGEYKLFDKGEKGLSTLAQLLLANNFMPKTLMLGTEKQIPSDCDVLIIAGPNSHLTADEERAINQYLEAGGAALFLIEHALVTTPDNPLSEDELKLNPSLNNILNNWGVHVNDDVVVDLLSNVGDVGSPATNRYLPHTAIVGGVDYTFFVRPRSIDGVEGARESLKLVPIVLTASEDKSWGEKNRTLEIKYDEGVDTKGPVPISYVIMEPKEEGEMSDTRVVVFTDADFLTNVFIEQYSNAKLGLKSLYWLTELDYQVLDDLPKVEVPKLNLTSREKRRVMVVLFLVPLFIVVAGVVRWVRHNN